MTNPNTNTKIPTPEEVEWDYFISQDNFDLAWKVVNYSLRLETKDRVALNIYSVHRDAYLSELRHKLQESKYRPSPAAIFYSPKSDGTLRPFVQLSIEDRLVYQALGNVILKNSYSSIAPYIDVSIFAHAPQPPNNAGEFSPFFFRRPFDWKYGRKTIRGQFTKYKNAVIRKIEKQYREGDGWLIRTDVASFYPSIEHRLLSTLLVQNGWISNLDIAKTLDQCLEKWGAVSVPNQLASGIPIGYETSDLLAVLLLLPIDKVLKSRGINHLRYVDDYYIFERGRTSASKALREFDLELQKVGLVRNSGKTQVEPCKADLLQRQKEERDLRKRLSIIKRDLNSDIHDLARGEKGLLDELQRICPPNITIDHALVQKFASDIGFILYRLDIHDDRAIQLAKLTLDWVPEYALHAARYLSQFVEQHALIEFVFKVAQNSPYSEVQIHCIEALISVHKYPENIIRLLIHWLKNHVDWWVRRKAAEYLLQARVYSKVIAEAAKTDTSVQVRAQSNITGFFLDNDLSRRVKIVNDLFSSNERYLQQVGIYLLARDNRIETRKIRRSKIDADLKELITSKADRDEETAARNKLIEFTGLLIDSRFSVTEAFGHSGRVLQRILDIENSENNYKATVEASIELMQRIGQYLVEGHSDNSDNFRLPTLSSSDLALDTDIEKAIAWLQERSDFFRDGHVARNTGRKEALASARNVLKCLIELAHKRMGIEMSSAQTEQKVRVFVSYSHRDQKWYNEFYSPIEALENYDQLIMRPWSDKDLETGDDWHEVIQSELKVADIVVCLVTNEFLKSKYIKQHELTPTLERARTNNDVKIFWIAVGDPSIAFKTPLGKFDCANKSHHPIKGKSTSQREKIWNQITLDLLKLAEKLAHERTENL